MPKLRTHAQILRRAGKNYTHDVLHAYTQHVRTYRHHGMVCHYLPLIRTGLCLSGRRLGDTAYKTSSARMTSERSGRSKAV